MPTFGGIRLGFSIQQEFSNKEIIELLTIYRSLPKERVKRFYNLFYLTRANIMRGELHADLEQKWNALSKKLDDAVGMKNYSHYFLEYTESSFCRNHVDDEESVGKTGVTLLYASDDLVGGDSILHLPHHKDNSYEFDVNWYRKEDEQEGRNIIPVIAHQEVGTTLWYDHKQNHSVSLVESGTRIVLISWYEG